MDFVDLQGYELILFAAVFGVGLGATGVYYFFRSAFPARKSDDVVPTSSADIAHQLEVREDIAESAADAVPPGEEASVEAPAKLEEIKPDLKVVAAPTLEATLSRTRANLWGRLKDVFSRDRGLAGEELEALEEILYTSDLGPTTVQRLMESLEESLSAADRSDADRVRSALRMEMNRIFGSLPNGHSKPDGKADVVISLASRPPRPQVWMIVGVNGAGKTTTIGKLSHRAARAGLKVMVVAGDTFRAAAGDQLKVWSDRAQVEIFSPEGVKDPSAVAFDGCSAAKARGYDLVIIDTAGRLHTQDNLMEELKKMKRVIQKVIPDAPHETLIVLDANSGQNALIQAKTFNQSLGLSGAILTKLDGSAKGGVAVGLACELSPPITLIGVGEGIDDLRSFNSQEFVESIL